ncbi:hypothetical protein DAPPUDRAFT_252390 [Daphnia pulex]|uniref:Uncharacterized protein n=1 Tax=Daphnia pulex TaxID=6669 RepID=E9H2K8_DAPPU|nr:hypothetical protein DAPPUDRAFT_252390 [Daphnia pulex]|eukprot:EFX74046.1 hypothetical protein DAPPUDRAFT_252390 [Daphnia pulex]
MLRRINQRDIKKGCQPDGLFEIGTSSIPKRNGLAELDVSFASREIIEAKNVCASAVYQKLILRGYMTCGCEPQFHLAENAVEWERKASLGGYQYGTSKSTILQNQPARHKKKDANLIAFLKLAQALFRRGMVHHFSYYMEQAT